MQKNRWDETARIAPIRYTASGAVDTEHYLQRAHRLRAEFVGGALQRLGSFLLRFLQHRFSKKAPRHRHDIQKSGELT